MPRKQPTLKLERSPLIFVLTQVRFSPQLKMEKYVPDIQEMLAKQGFPRNKKEVVQQFSFDGVEPKGERDTRWVFSSRNLREAVVLSSTFLVYETSDYDVFETFTRRFGPILDLVGNTVGIEFAEQIGLRYVDLIRPANGKIATDFLRENVRGLSQHDLGATSARHQFITQARTDYGDLFVRSFDNAGPNMMPPDLVSTHLKLKVDPEDLKNESYRILDIDHITRGDFDFDAAGIIEILEKLHDFTSKAFQAAVTDEAIEFWKTKE